RSIEDRRPRRARRVQVRGRRVDPGDLEGEVCEARWSPAPHALASGAVCRRGDPTQSDRLVLGAHRTSGRTLDQAVRPVRRGGPVRRTWGDLVVRPASPVRRVDDVYPRVRTPDRVRPNALDFADLVAVPDE